MAPGWRLGWGGDETPLISYVDEGGPADAAGLRVGDRVIGAEGRRPVTDPELRAIIEEHAGRELTLAIERDGHELSVAVVPASEDGQGRIGVGLTLPSFHRDLSLPEAAAKAWREGVSYSVLLFHVLKGLATRDVPPEMVSGPIGIAQVARNTLFESPRHFLWLLAFFSLQLGILNLLPIPVLDGGHIFILGIEGIIRRDLSERLKERIMMVGFVFLLAFMTFVIYLDIRKF
jgi:regulator of sigma E protease